MNRSWFVPLVAGLLLRTALELHAQEGPASSPSEKPAESVRRFFDRPIDFWQRGLGFEKEGRADSTGAQDADRKPAAKSQASEWGQVVKLPDGSLTFHELPHQLVEVLENPSPEKIRAYFEWRLERTQKILRAAELMKEYRNSALGKTGDHDPRAAEHSPGPVAVPELPSRDPVGTASAAPAAAKSPFRVTYFHKQGCPHCDHQDLILAEWLKDKSEGKMRVVEFGANPDLWRTYQVRGTPSLLIEDLTSKKTVFLEGLARPEALDRALLEGRLGESRDAKVNGESNK